MALRMPDSAAVSVSVREAFGRCHHVFAAGTAAEKVLSPLQVRDLSEILGEEKRDDVDQREEHSHRPGGVHLA